MHCWAPATENQGVMHVDKKEAYGCVHRGSMAVAYQDEDVCQDLAQVSRGQLFHTLQTPSLAPSDLIKSARIFDGQLNQTVITLDAERNSRCQSTGQKAPGKRPLTRRRKVSAVGAAHAVCIQNGICPSQKDGSSTKNLGRRLVKQECSLFQAERYDMSFKTICQKQRTNRNNVRNAIFIHLTACHL